MPPGSSYYWSSVDEAIAQETQGGTSLGQTVAGADGGAPSRTEAFEHLILPEVNAAFALACAMLRDRQAADHAVQEAAIRAWGHIHELRPGSPPRAWFLAIVADQCRDTRRGGWWRLVRGQAMPERAQADQSDRIANGLDHDRAMDALSREQRALLVLRYHLDLPVLEVARVLSLRSGTVKSRLHRTLRHLRAATAPPPSQEDRR